MKAGALIWPMHPFDAVVLVVRQRLQEASDLCLVAGVGDGLASAGVMSL